MRHDMGRLLVESRRHGSRGKHERRIDPRADLEDLPSKGRMGRNWHVWPRDLGDRLAPLERFLDRAVGRQWDDVWSEIMRSANRWSVKGDHLLEHVRGFVYMTANEWRAAFGRSGLEPSFGFYVDDEGVLRRCLKDARRRRIHDAKEFGVVEIRYRRLEIRLIDGAWWEVKLAPVDFAALGQKDAVTGETVRLRGWSRERAALFGELLAPPGEFEAMGCLYEHRGLWAVSRRRLSKNELAAAGLRKLFA